jgi:hypothetical protein
VFDDKVLVASNLNAIHTPNIDMVNDSIAICTWTQTRFTPETIGSISESEVLKSFVQGQDIWYAIYNMNEGSMIITEMLEDNTSGLRTGRAEANPDVTILSDKLALIVWQVADLDTHQADLWYATVENVNGQWQVSEPANFTNMDGVETEIVVASTGNNGAVAIWRNTLPSNPDESSLLSSTFTNGNWTTPEELLPRKNNSNYNYFDMDFENGQGAVIFTTYTADTVHGNFETLGLLTWDGGKSAWDTKQAVQLYTDSIYHLQLPRISINEQGKTAIAFKGEKIGYFDVNERISQADLFVGDINDPGGEWQHVAGSEFVCDTTKQIDELGICFAGHDTLVIISHEFIMGATNTNYSPLNGLVFGDPYMNLVLRSVRVNELGDVENVDENQLLKVGNDLIIPYYDVALEQNFPNPCSHHTTIKFYLPKKTSVLIEVFNMKGMLVGTVVDTELSPGYYEMKLDVSALESGIYIYSLKTEDVIKTGKMAVER